MSKKGKALQVGAGMVGRVIVKDMLPDFDYTVLDLSEKNLAEVKQQYPSVNVVQGDCTVYSVI